MKTENLKNGKDNSPAKVNIKEESKSIIKEEENSIKNSIEKMGNPENMAQFLSIVEKISAEKDKNTGNGRLDMAELLAAFNNFKDDDKDSRYKSCSSATPPPTSASPPPPPPPTSAPP